MSLQGSRTPPGLIDHRITTCKICDRGIFHGQKREWSINPLGLCHVDCMREREKS